MGVRGQRRFVLIVCLCKYQWIASPDRYLGDAGGLLLGQGRYWTLSQQSDLYDNEGGGSQGCMYKVRGGVGRVGHR